MTNRPKGMTSEKKLPGSTRAPDGGSLEALRAEVLSIQASLGSLADAIRESGRAQADLSSALQRVMEHLGTLQEDHDRVKVVLWEKTDAQQTHLGRLQQAHDDLKATVGSQVGRLGRLEAIWSDLQREMTTLADAIARSKIE
jgi:chromosome segregation ATPase